MSDAGGHHYDHYECVEYKESQHKKAVCFFELFLSVRIPILVFFHMIFVFLSLCRLISP